MVRIKHTARPIYIKAFSEVESLAFDKALETSVLQREASAEAIPSQSFEDSEDCESQSDCSEDSKTASDD
jgi:hypothetical protein